MELFQFYWNFINEFRRDSSPAMLEKLTDHIWTWHEFFYEIRPGILRGLKQSGRPADERPAHLFNIQPDSISVARGRP